MPLVTESALASRMADMDEFDEAAADHRMTRRSEYAHRSHAKRRAQKAGAVVGDVDRAAIIVRDDCTCYLCAGRCDPEEIHLDHIVPLSRGGAHEPSNLAVACARCNLRKAASLTDKRPPALR